MASFRAAEIPLCERGLHVVDNPRMNCGQCDIAMRVSAKLLDANALLHVMSKTRKSWERYPKVRKMMKAYGFYGL